MLCATKKTGRTPFKSAARRLKLRWEGERFATKLTQFQAPFGTSTLPRFDGLVNARVVFDLDDIFGKAEAGYVVSHAINADQGHADQRPTLLARLKRLLF